MLDISRKYKYLKTNLMKIYNSEEFINEMYLKIDASKDLFKECVESLCMYVTGFAFIKKKLKLKPANDTDVKNGKINIFDYYGITYETINSDKGGKVVVKFDNTHSIHLYPTTEKEDDNNTLKFLNYDQRLDVYAVASGKTEKICNSLELYDVLEPNRRTNWGKSTMFDERNKLNKKVKEYVSSWGLTKKYNELNNELEKDSVERLERLDRESKERDIEIKKSQEKYRQNQERVKNGIVLEFYKDGNLFAPMANYNSSFYDYTKSSFDLYSLKRKDKNQKKSELTLSVLMRQLLKEYCANELRECLSNPKKPNGTIITDFIKKYKRYKYTPRKLKEDNYKLVDYFKNYAKDIPCQHCGKTNIVNIMVIEAPDKNKYLVGNECVFHLVKLSWDEFEEKWNFPFTQASKMTDKMKEDQKRGFASNWFITKDTHGAERFVYVATPEELLDNDWFAQPIVRRPPNYKFLKRNFRVVDFSEGFMKRMLPREYVESIYTNVDIKYLMNCIYPQESYTKFSFGGVEYNLNDKTFYDKVPSKDNNMTVGEFKISVKDDDGLPNIEIRFRNYTYKIKYNGIQ